MTTLQIATKKDYSRIKNIMGDVFDDDPISCWIFGETLDIGLYYGLAAKVLYFDKGLCWIAQDDLGGALLLKPGIKKQIPLFKQLPLIWPILRDSGVKAFYRGICVDEFLAKCHLKTPHYYLFAIGARKGARGKGIGSTLMQACIDEAEQQNMPIYLDNSKEENLNFYRGHGFEVIEKVRPGGKDGPPMWRMLRPAQTAN